MTVAFSERRPDMTEIVQSIDRLLPTPERAAASTVRFVCTPDTTLSVIGMSTYDRARIQRLLRFLPFNLAASDAGDQASVVQIGVDESDPRPDHYVISVTERELRIVGASVDACAYALATVRQLFPVDAYRHRPDASIEWSVPCCEIDDAPQCGWRGLLLDPSRHFFPKHAVLRVIERMGDLRLNRLQLHLSDDQGWRFESRRFPLLHEKGSCRPRTQLSHFNEPLVYDDTPHGGYYSHADLREIVAFAADRGIVVVPEIDLPGHTGSLIAAYPELGVPKRDTNEVSGEWGISRSLLSPQPEALRMLAELFAEIAEVFPSPWIHIGGDESRLSVWANDETTMAYARSIGIDDPKGLFARFLAEVGDIITGLGRTMITWDDAFAAAPEANPDAVVMAWRGMAIAERAADAGRSVVLAPVIPLYFDYAQADGDREPLAIGGPISVDDVATFDPACSAWSDPSRGRVLGMQAQLWTEFIANERELDFALFPRLGAFAEVAWTGRPTDNGFSERLAAYLARLDASGVEYRPVDGPRPWQEGGSGRRAHRTFWPLRGMMRRLEQAALTGTVAFGEDHD